jgi:hypothetical protein
VGEVAAQLLDGGGAGQAGHGVGEVAQLVAAGDQVVASGGEVADPVCAGALVEAGGFERGQVAVDGRLGLGDLRGDGGQFGGVPAGAVAAQGRLRVNGGGDEVGAGVEADQGLGDGGVEVVGVDAAGGAAGGAVAGPGLAGVVAVAAQFAGG